MRANKQAIIMTGIITVVSFLVIIIFNLGLVHEIALACFGSAILGLVVAYTGYRAERRAAMEDFWNEAFELIRKIGNLKHLEFDAPDELVIEALSEDFWNDGLENKRNELKKWAQDNARSFERVMVESKKMVHLIMNQYIVFSKADSKSISNAYGRLDFLFGNKTVRQMAYEKIYNRIREFQDNCLSQSFHFGLIKKGQGNLGVCILKIKELDCLAFTEKGRAIYRSLYDDLNRNLEDFRSKIYGKKPEYEEIFPISERFNLGTDKNEKTIDVSEEEKRCSLLQCRNS